MKQINSISVSGILFFVFSVLMNYSAISGERSVDPASTSNQPVKTWSVSAKRPPHVIIRAPSTEVMDFAASELTRYLEIIFGHSYSSKRTTSRNPVILLEKVNNDDPGEEGFEILASGDTLYIRSSGDAGIIYGTYEFLRRYAGCRFSGLGSDGEHVPSLKVIKANDLPIKIQPELFYRGLQLNLSKPSDKDIAVPWVDWMTKNGYNYIKCHINDSVLVWIKEILWPEMRKRAMKIDYGHHNLHYWLSPGKYFEDHPEWFPMNAEGKRVPEQKQLAVCTSNRKAVQEVIRNIKNFLNDHPESQTVGIIPEDGYGMCHCTACTELDISNGIDPEEQFQRRPYSNLALTRRYSLFVTEVARAVQEEYPLVRIVTSAYVDLTKPDEKIRMEPNMITWVATYWRDGERPLAEDSPSEVNREFFDILKQWRKVHPGKVITYSYYMGMQAQLSLPYPQDRVILRDWENFKNIDIDGATMQNWQSNHHVYGLNLLAFSRAAWYDEVDPDALLDEYLEGMFGSAAGEVKPIFDKFHEAWERAEMEGIRIRPDGKSIILLLETTGEKFLNKCLEQARNKASDERERRQVESLATAIDYWEMASEVFRLEKMAQAEVQQGNLESGKSYYKEARDQCEKIISFLPELAPGWGQSTLDQRWERYKGRLVMKE